MLLYVTGSYPENQEGIASGAKVLLDAMVDIVGKEKILLLTTDTPIISNNIDKNALVEYRFLNNWRVTKKNIQRVERILDQYPISAVHMEYPGDLYGKTFLASFLPWIVHRYSKKKNRKITYNVRLHEFTRARFLRKLAIIPILMAADRIYVPAQKDREVISRFAKERVFKTTIGTNIKVIEENLRIDSKLEEKITISYFGSVYPGKGIERMLSFWKKIKEKDSKNEYRFKVIGEIGTDENNHFREYHEQVWRLIEELGLKDVLEVTGFVTDEEVSKEIGKSSVATLFYEDGLTLRRGSFLAYLAHGIPIVTSLGDDETRELFEGARGICMASDDETAEEAVYRLAHLAMDDRKEIRNENIALSEYFDWKKIASGFLNDYGIF